MLHVRMLGAFELREDNRVIDGVNTPRMQALLGWLMLHRGAVQQRAFVASLLWPDVSEAQARHNLRQLILQLRQTLPGVERHLVVSASTLEWRMDSDVGLDIAEFEGAQELAADAQARDEIVRARAELERAAALYWGDLIPGCYDEWVLPERERLRREFAGVLKQLVALLERQGATGEAIGYAQRLVDLDPLDEEAYAVLIRLHARSGDRAKALRTYRVAVEVLERELGISPGASIEQARSQLSSATVSAGMPVGPRGPVLEMPAPLIGRQAEWQRMQAWWEQARSGRAHFAVVAGEAGIGKSRLAEELMLWASDHGAAAAQARAYEAEGHLPFGPVIDLLRSEAIRPNLGSLDRIWMSELARILPELLKEHPDLPQPSPAGDASQRQRFFEALARATLVGGQPLLLVIDDLQWCDQETLEWLRYLLRFDKTAPLMIVGTVRSEEIDPQHPVTRMLLDLRSTGAIFELRLNALDAAESTHLANHILRREMVFAEATQLYSDTEGNPLFVVEMARAGLGKDIEGSEDPTVRLPTRVRAVIQARLSRLSPAGRDLLSLAATIGRAFSIDVLVAASDAGEEGVLNSLDELWQRHIVRARDGQDYDFTHDKLRDVAYAELSPARRRLLHRRVARALEAVHAANLGPVSAQLAAHYEQSGAADQALGYSVRAAQVARDMYAYEDAMRQVDRGQALLAALPPGPRRDEHEYDLLILAGLSFGSTTDYRAERQADALARAQQLGERLGKPANPAILRALSTNRIALTQYDESLAAGQQLLKLAEHMRDRTLLVEGHEAVGITQFWLGAFENARVHLEDAIACYDPEYSSMHIARCNWDPGVISRCRLALDLWFLGYPDQALSAMAESLSIARRVQHAFSMGYSSFWDVFLHMMLDNPAVVRERSDEIVALSRQHNLSWWLCQGTIAKGWADAVSGELESGILTMERGLVDFGAHGMVNFMAPHYLTQLARFYVARGQVEDGMQRLTSALNLTKITHERWSEAELYRAQGELLTVTGAPAQEVEGALLRALDTAKLQHAKALELRAATSLARHWQSLGGISDALGVLRPVYDWFREGFETNDLRKARALLCELTIS